MYTYIYFGMHRFYQSVQEVITAMKRIFASQVILNNVDCISKTLWGDLNPLAFELQQLNKKKSKLKFRNLFAFKNFTGSAN